MTGLVVGFDLDLTLFDTTPAVAAVLGLAADRVGHPVDVPAVLAALGPPLDELMSGHLAAKDVPGFVAGYRALYPVHGPRAAVLLPGAAEAVAAVRGLGGSPVVLTGQPVDTARAHLVHSGLDVDEVVGSVWGSGKAWVLKALGAFAYVGDHPADVAAAHEAGAHAVAVSTGRHGPVELAGAHIVLPTLEDFPRWLASTSHRGTGPR
ncbi:HAD family hydrolase [Lentzea sp. NPDC059081]|uniref:HAD family hydrolase n=1 Tax=Lentzea sp. NPDC059081 TaxID=3346719 RepID=UPI0036954D49